MTFSNIFSESEAVIQGPLYVKAGSTINLTCSISDPDMQGKLYMYTVCIV